MTGDFNAYYLRQEELKSVLEINKRFKPVYFPYILITIVHFFNEETLEGIISFADYNTIPIPITKKNELDRNITQEYYDKCDGAFTFDGIRFFKILNARVKRDEEGILVFTFRYIKQSSFTEKNTAFMIMPFKYDNLNSFYLKNIKQYLEASDLKIHVYRSDDFKGTDVVADTILEQIKKAEFIICDITNCNKNVFFEIGFAKGLNKNIIFLLEQNKPAEFFDVNHIRRIEYSYEREDEFQNLLRDTLLSVRNNSL